MSYSPSVVRPLVVLDCDSTTIQDEVIELLAEAAGTRTLVAEVTERAMRGELDFSESLRERVRTLQGTPETVFAETFQRVRLSPGIEELISEVHRRGGKVGVVSGGFMKCSTRSQNNSSLTSGEPTAWKRQMES